VARLLVEARISEAGAFVDEFLRGIRPIDRLSDARGDRHQGGGRRREGAILIGSPVS